MRLIDYLNKCDLPGVLKYYEEMVDDITKHAEGVEYVIDTLKQIEPAVVDGNPFEVWWYIPAEDKEALKLGFAEPDDDPYWSVSILNRGFEEPPKDLKPWGCTGDDLPPEGYYDCNDLKYSKFFAVTGIPWNELVHKEVIVNCNRDFDINEIVAALIFEITFWGYTQEQCEEFLNEIKGRMDDYKEAKENGTLEYRELDVDKLIDGELED